MRQLAWHCGVYTAACPTPLASPNLLDNRLFHFLVSSTIRYRPCIPLVWFGGVDISTKDNNATKPVNLTYRPRRLVLRDWICRNRWRWPLVDTPWIRCQRWSGDLEREADLFREMMPSSLTRQVLPLFFPVTYRFILPDFSSLGSSQSYQALASGPDTEAPDDDTLAPTAPEGKTTYLTTGEKLALMRPLVLRYMLPLCAVYIEEYIINSVSSHLVSLTVLIYRE